MPGNKLDSHFVIASIVIGGVYTALVALVQFFVGKDAAGVTAVALSALMVAILQKFETLRFKRSEPQEDIILIVPTLHGFTILFVSFAFLGGMLVVQPLEQYLWRMPNLEWPRVLEFFLGLIPFLITVPIIASSRLNFSVLTIGVSVLLALILRYLFGILSRAIYGGVYLDEMYLFLVYRIPYWASYAILSGAFFYLIRKYLLRDTRESGPEEIA